MDFPITPGQCTYIRKIQSHKPIVVVNGPAGSGKSFLACQKHLERYRKES